MSTLAVKAIEFTNEDITLHFSDGKTVTRPLVWYPRLLNATQQQREQWEICGKNRGIHWPAVDEDLSIEGLLRGAPSLEYMRATRHAVPTIDTFKTQTKITTPLHPSV